MNEFPTIQVGELHLPYVGLEFPDDAENPYRSRLLSDIARIVVHHSVTPGDGETEDEELATIARIWEYHRFGQGWPGVGYHALVFPSGRMYLTGRAQDIRYHVADGNRDSYGLCLVGDFTHGPPAAKQTEAAAHFISELRYGLGSVRPLVGHRDLNQTSCPGGSWELWRGRLEHYEQGTGTVQAVLLPRIERLQAEIEELKSVIRSL